MDKIVFSTDSNRVEFAKALRTGAYIRLFRGAIAERVWWDSLTPNEKSYARAVVIGKIRPDLVLTRMSAALVLGGQARTETEFVTCAVRAVSSRSGTDLPGTKLRRLPSYAKLTAREVVIRSDGKIISQRAALPKMAQGINAGAVKDIGAGAGKDINAVAVKDIGAGAVKEASAEIVTSNGADKDNTLRMVTICTNPESTVYEIASGYPLKDSLIPINSLLNANANKRRSLEKEHPLSKAGAYRSHLNRNVVAELLRARSYTAFRSKAGRFRQHDIRYEYAADLLEKCFRLVWENRGKKGVRNALLALLLVSDQCDSSRKARCPRFEENSLDRV